MKTFLERSRTLKRKKTEVMKVTKHDELWTPNELTPIQEEVKLAENFAPTSFQVFTPEEAS